MYPKAVEMVSSSIRIRPGGKAEEETERGGAVDFGEVGMGKGTERRV